MNILITGDDGPESYGLKVLINAARKMYREATQVVIVPDKPETGQSMAITICDELEFDRKQVEPRFWTIKGRPADVIDHAFIRASEYLPPDKTWDLVLSGVNYGHNVGTDVFRSGTVGAAMMATCVYGCAAVAFSQFVPRDKFKDADATKPEVFFFSEKHLYEELVALKPRIGECYNLNFPSRQPMQSVNAPVAHYSLFRQPPTSIIPRARKDMSDAARLTEGYITISQLQLRVNPNSKY